MNSLFFIDENLLKFNLSRAELRFIAVLDEMGRKGSRLCNAELAKASMVASPSYISRLAQRINYKTGEELISRKRGYYELTRKLKASSYLALPYRFLASHSKKLNLNSRTALVLKYISARKEKFAVNLKYLAKRINCSTRTVSRIIASLKKYMVITASVGRVFNAVVKKFTSTLYIAYHDLHTSRFEVASGS